jgi:hypothetical protein
MAGDSSHNQVCQHILLAYTCNVALCIKHGQAGASQQQQAMPHHNQPAPCTKAKHTCLLAHATNEYGSLTVPNMCFGQKQDARLDGTATQTCTQQYSCICALNPSWPHQAKWIAVLVSCISWQGEHGLVTGPRMPLHCQPCRRSIQATKALNMFKSPVWPTLQLCMYIQCAASCSRKKFSGQATLSTCRLDITAMPAEAPQACTESKQTHGQGCRDSGNPHNAHRHSLPPGITGIGRNCTQP